MNRCIDLGKNNYYLESEQNISCFSEEHNKWAFSIGILNFMGWGILCPLIIFIILSKKAKKDLLNENENQIVYSFLYFGYKKEYYYWEFITLIRKIVSIVILVLLSQVSPFFQVFYRLQNHHSHEIGYSCSFVDRHLCETTYQILTIHKQRTQ